MKKKTALISVYYKDGLIDFASELVGLGWQIISTGGTKRALEEAEIDVIDIQEVTGTPEMLDGRVKTLSPKIFGGILYRRDDQEHIETIDSHDIESIDMVVNILYPFEETVDDENATEMEIIEKIDIGGPSMIRAAAKNYKDVLIVVSNRQYDEIINELKKNENPSEEFRIELAKKAFERTASYDIAIAKYFQEKSNDEWPEKLLMSFEKSKELRYGENPHQKAAFYKDSKDEGNLNSAKIIQGKELSYNNILDISAGIGFIKDFDEEPTAIGIKHTNPCAIASDADIESAYDKCIIGDKESIFGGIIILNRAVTKAIAEKMTSFFLEIVVAPKIEDEAVEIFKKKPNLRVIEIEDLMTKDCVEKNFYKASGGVLVQDMDSKLYEDLKTVTAKEPTEEEMKDLLFGYKVVKCLKSNAIAIVKGRKTLGLGIGDVNRFFAAKHALDMSGDEAEGAIVASDGFFPFADSIKEFSDKGISAIIQPGGSIKDEEIIEFADKNNISMVFTGMRHFRH